MRRSPLLRSAITGKLIEDRDLSKLYLVKFDAKRTPDVHSAIEAFQELEEVEFAEPNYLVFALGTPASKPFDGRTAETDNHVMSANSATVPAVTINDPYYISQWGPAGISLPAGRCYLTPTASPVKAFAFNFGDGTGIVEQLSNCNSSNCQMFDLQGRPVSSPSRGIYTRYA